MSVNLDSRLVSVNPPCGCRIIGSGTPHSPLRIVMCETHHEIDIITSRVSRAADAAARLDGARARKVTVDGELLAHVIEIVRPALWACMGSKLFLEIVPRELYIDPSGDLQAGDGQVFTAEFAAVTFGLKRILAAFERELADAIGKDAAADKLERNLEIVRGVLVLLKARE